MRQPTYHLCLVVLLALTGPAAAQTAFTGSASCTSCHQAEHQAWQGSHHQLAMAEPGPSTVLGDFNDAVFAGKAGDSRFFMRNGNYWVATSGPDGRATEYPVRYTLGWVPLQQYLLEIEGGRLQALSVAWDSRPASEGGQRWFHLYPDETISHDDPLHWTKLSQNWNFMCAECHTTDFKKRFNADTLAYNSQWMEHGVGCEGCHGPGEAHIGQARSGNFSANAGLLTQLGRTQAFHFVEGKATAQPISTSSHNQIEACGRCHSRREVIAEPYDWGKPLTQTHRPRLLDPPLYFSDGQIRDEVYVYGSFLQSRMYQAGVQCGDCHEPHSSTLRLEGNTLCAQCHRPDVFDTPQHHHHEDGSEGAACVNCHMPERTYMVVDPRRDHSLRIPRPDLPGEANRPNACNQCHQDKTAQWATAQINLWVGDSSWQTPHWGNGLFHSVRQTPDAQDMLRSLANHESAPAIVRATALARLDSPTNPRSTETIRTQLAHPDPLIRIAALAAMEGLPPEWRTLLGQAALTDPIKAVRVEAAQALAPAYGSLNAQARAQFDAAIAEYKAVQEINGDRPQAHMNLGVLYNDLGKTSQAEQAYRQAIAIDPAYYQAYINLADLMRQLGNNQQAKATLLEAIALAPAAPQAHHALGLTYVRLSQLDKALPALEKAQQLDPANPRYAYVYAVALEAGGQLNAAANFLKGAIFRFPGNRDILYTLAVYSAKAGQIDAARKYTTELLRYYPQDPQGLKLARQLGLQ